VSWPLSLSIVTLHLPDLAIVGKFDNTEQGKSIAPRLTPDGQYVVVPTSDGAIHVYRPDGTAVSTCNNHYYTDAIAFRADGTMVTGAVGYQVRLWNLASGSLSATIALPSADRRRFGLSAGGTIGRLAFSPDGKTLAATVTGANTRALLLDVHSKVVRTALADPSLKPDTGTIASTMTAPTASGGNSSSPLGDPEITPGVPGEIPHVRVHNDSGYSVSILCQGPVSRTINIPPGGIAKFDLPAGSYRVSITFPGEHIRSLVNNDLYESGKVYSYRVFVKLIEE